MTTLEHLIQPSENNPRWRLPRRQDGLKTFETILSVSKKLFAQNSFSQTSVNQIIEESGLSVGTFYIYFDDKLAVYQYLLKDYSKTIKSVIRKATKKCINREETERIGLKAFILFSLKDPLSYKIIWESTLIDWDTFKDYYSSFASRYIDNLQKAEQKHEIKADMDFETLSYLLMGVSNFIGLQVLFMKKTTEAEIDRIVDTAITVFKSGFLK